MGDNNGEMKGYLDILKGHPDILSCYKGCLLGGAVGDALGLSLIHIFLVITLSPLLPII